MFRINVFSRKTYLKFSEDKSCKTKLLTLNQRLLLDQMNSLEYFLPFFAMLDFSKV